MPDDTRTDIDDRKEWKAPELRATLPARRTAGGPFDLNDQDDAFYSTS